MQDHERAARQSLIDTCIGMNASGLSLHKSGNASLRWGSGLLITPTGRAYDRLQPEDIVYLEADGSCPPGQLIPSSEWRFHVDILHAFPACNAVVHVHSTHATALAEEVENLARQYLLARSLGETRDLPADEMARVVEKFRSYGQQRSDD